MRSGVGWCWRRGDRAGCVCIQAAETQCLQPCIRPCIRTNGAVQESAGLTGYAATASNACGAPLDADTDELQYDGCDHTSALTETMTTRASLTMNGTIALFDVEAE